MCWRPFVRSLTASASRYATCFMPVTEISTRTSATTRTMRTSARAAVREIMAACVAACGTITGEHGIGLDKLEYMNLIFSPDSLAAMCQLREVFDPDRRANPGKVVPVHSCREWHGAPRSAWTA